MSFMPSWRCVRQTNKISLDFDILTKNLYQGRVPKNQKKLARMTLAHKKGNLFDKSIQISRLPYGVDSRSVDLVWSCLSEIDQYRAVLCRNYSRLGKHTRTKKKWGRFSNSLSIFLTIMDWCIFWMCISQCKLVVNIKKWIDINEYMYVCIKLVHACWEN